MKSRCSSPTESRWRMSRSPHSCTNGRETGRSASPFPCEDRSVPHGSVSRRRSRYPLPGLKKMKTTGRTRSISKPTVGLTKETPMATGVITGPMASQTRTFRTSSGLSPRFDETPIPGQVPPDHVSERRQKAQDPAVQAQSNRVSRIAAHDGCGERDEGDAHEEEDVQPHQGAVHTHDEVEHLVVGKPVHPEDDETDEIGRASCRERV